jgi:hypothetical protein
LKSDHGTTECTIVIVEDNQELALPDEERKAFNSLLPIHEKKVNMKSTVNNFRFKIKSLHSYNHWKKLDRTTSKKMR